MQAGITTVRLMIDNTGGVFFQGGDYCKVIIWGLHCDIFLRWVVLLRLLILRLLEMLSLQKVVTTGVQGFEGVFSTVLRKCISLAVFGDHPEYDPNSWVWYPRTADISPYYGMVSHWVIR